MKKISNIIIIVVALFIACNEKKGSKNPLMNEKSSSEKIYYSLKDSLLDSGISEKDSTVRESFLKFKSHVLSFKPNSIVPGENLGDLSKNQIEKALFSEEASQISIIFFLKIYLHQLKCCNQSYVIQCPGEGLECDILEHLIIKEDLALPNHPTTGMLFSEVVKTSWPENELIDSLKREINLEKLRIEEGI